MPNYDLTNKMASGLILQYCRGMYDQVDPLLTPDQSRIKTANRTAIEAEVQKCVSAFDMTEMTAHRRIAMRYCFVNNDYTVAGQASRMKTYDQCMNQNDVLTAFCTRELKYRSELSRTPNVADQRCPAPRPNFREGLVIRNGGHDDFGHPVVVASTGPGLPPILLAPMEPGIIQRGGGASPSVSTANPVTARTPSQPVQPASDRAASAQPVAPVPPVAAAAPQMRDLNLRYAALLRRAVRAKAGVAQIEQRLAGQGFGLRTDVRDARSRLDSQLQAAMESISRGDADHAEESLRYAEGALGTIEKFLGR